MNIASARDNDVTYENACERKKERERDGDACFSRRVGGGRGESGVSGKRNVGYCRLNGNRYLSRTVQLRIRPCVSCRAPFPCVFRRSPPTRRPCSPLPFFSLSSTCILSNLNFWKSIFPKDSNLIYIYLNYY